MRDSATPEAQRDATCWYSRSADQVFAELGSVREGLSDAEVQLRLEKYGPNKLRPPERSGPLVRFAQQFHNVLIYVLLAAAGVTALLGHWIDTSVILGVVIINAVIGFLQEGKAERALDAIRNMLSIQASVIRDGKRLQTPAEGLVPGDVVLLRPGDKVPADIRLDKIKTLQIDEALLTGESLAVTKDAQSVPETAPLGDRRCMAYSGTLVTYGQGSGVVVGTGDATEIGRISTLLAEVEVLTTPLLRQMAVFGRWLTFAIIAMATLAFLFGIIVRDFSADEMFLAAVGLAVAAIPEGLPAIMTITLAIGVQQMAHRRAIIRRLPAVETLGSVSVICSDKTGTLTRNEMTVQTIVAGGKVFDVTGAGYAPVGSLCLDGTEVTTAEHPVLGEMMLAAVLCNEASLRQQDAAWVVDGDPTEGALLTVGMKAGLDPMFEGRSLPRTDLVPFESEHRYMATLHHDHLGNGYIFVKGAPERIFEMCDRQHTANTGEDAALSDDYWHGYLEEIAARGQRVLAVATKHAASDHHELTFGDVENGLSLVGLFGLADPPRDEAIKSVQTCLTAGIAVKMITGDHAATARAIGGQLGLQVDGDVLTGQDIDAMSETTLRARALEVDIFARTSPEHKLHLVSALQASGHVVAMTGDGVNDAPALRRADVGVAMGLKGTEAAKESSEMVLADDNFASIAEAVEEGRTVYDNLKKSITFILPTNGGEAFTIIAAIALGQALPITPVQILWVNMITAVTLALALAFERAQPDIMDRPPRDSREPLLSVFLVWRIAFVSTILVFGVFGIFLFELESGYGIDRARTVAVNTLVIFEVFYLFNTRNLSASVLNLNGLFGSRPALVASAIVILMQVAFTYAPPMQELFKSASLDLATWGRIVLVGASVFLLVEAEKAVLRWYGDRNHARPLAAVAGDGRGPDTK